MERNEQGKETTERLGLSGEVVVAVAGDLEMGVGPVRRGRRVAQSATRVPSRSFRERSHASADRASRS